MAYWTFTPRASCPQAVKTGKNGETCRRGCALLRAWEKSQFQISRPSPGLFARSSGATVRMKSSETLKFSATVPSSTPAQLIVNYALAGGGIRSKANRSGRGRTILGCMAANAREYLLKHDLETDEWFLRHKLTKPSKCPECHSTWLMEPKIGVENKIGAGKSPSR